MRHSLRATEVPVSYRRRVGVSKITGTVRIALASPPAPVVSWPTQPHRKGRLSSTARAAWPGFHGTIARSLSDTGTVIMTTPSPLHQKHLRTHKPEGLQVVDETLELSRVPLDPSRRDLGGIDLE